MMLTFVAAMLLGAAQAAAAPAPVTKAEAPNPDLEVRCRKLPVTGSLARFTKECRTVAEWRRLDDGNREAATKIQDRGLVVSCGSAANGC